LTKATRQLVPMVNLLNKPLIVRLAIRGGAFDLLSEEEVDLASIKLEPMEPRLLKCKR